MNFTVASTVAGTEKALYFTIAVSAFFLIATTAVMIYFVIRYSRKRNPIPGNITGNFWLETAWTVIPTLLVLLMFWYGFVSYETVRKVPGAPLEVQVQARKWAWNFEYPNKKQSERLYVPLGRPVNLIMTSKDVIHSFFVPAFRFKYDVVPGSVHHITFTPLQTGTFDIFCAEYCGTGHSAMLSSVVVMPPREFSEWYDKPLEQKPIHVEEVIEPSPALAKRGQEVFATYCVTCHGPTGHGENLPGVRNLS